MSTIMTFTIHFTTVLKNQVLMGHKKCFLGLQHGWRKSKDNHAVCVPQTWQYFKSLIWTTKHIQAKVLQSRLWQHWLERQCSGANKEGSDWNSKVWNESHDGDHHHLIQEQPSFQIHTARHLHACQSNHPTTLEELKAGTSVGSFNGKHN